MGVGQFGSSTGCKRTILCTFLMFSKYFMRYVFILLVLLCEIKICTVQRVLTGGGGGGIGHSYKS